MVTSIPTRLQCIFDSKEAYCLFHKVRDTECKLNDFSRRKGSNDGLTTSYPKLMIYSGKVVNLHCVSFIVLFSTSCSGTVVWAGSSLFEIGHHRNDWKPDVFRDVDDVVNLYNVY